MTNIVRFVFNVGNNTHDVNNLKKMSCNICANTVGVTTRRQNKMKLPSHMEVCTNLTWTTNYICWGDCKGKLKYD